MKEVEDIYNYISQRLTYWQYDLKKERNEILKDHLRGQIFEASKILKYINEKYGVSLTKKEEN